MTDKWSIEDFLSQYSNENTRRLYRSTLRGYFTLFYPELPKNDTDTLDKELVPISIQYMQQDKDFRKDLMRFRKHIDDLAPKTIAAKLAIIIRYFEDNHIKFNKNFIRNLKGRGATEAISKEHVPDKSEIARIIEYMPIQAKVLTIILASSGMRIGEAMKLRLRDLDLDQEPARINLRADYTKTKKSRLVFISTEAKELLLEWLDYRPSFIEKNTEYLSDELLETYADRVFPFTGSNFRKHWGNALKKAGLFEKDSKTSRMTIRPHTLRKFFRTYGRWKTPDVAEALMGHTSGLTAIYARFDQAEDILREGYLEAEPNLSISQNTQTIIELKEKVDTQSEDIQRLVTDLSVKNVRLQDEVNELRDQVKETNAQLSDTFNQIIHEWDESDRSHMDMMMGMHERINGLETLLARHMPEEEVFELIDLNLNPASPLELEEEVDSKPETEQPLKLEISSS